jgi:hypothetical protein
MLVLKQLFTFFKACGSITNSVNSSDHSSMLKKQGIFAHRNNAKKNVQFEKCQLAKLINQSLLLWLTIWQVDFFEVETIKTNVSAVN